MWIIPCVNFWCNLIRWRSVFHCSSLVTQDFAPVWPLFLSLSFAIAKPKAREIDPVLRKYSHRPWNCQKNEFSLFLILDLIHCTNEPNVSIPQLANLLIERSQNTNWTVVFKALITVHHMMCYGNEVITFRLSFDFQETPVSTLL